ncbi:MAG: CDP-glycerol glycerophosphotransferase family protein [Methanobrevibacter sp.]|nr:CDP-glycerol glycerophosphotransferase family protein [Methanobrevibacter sp.]
MDEFKFSIIISAYNSELWISQSIKSIIKQTLNFKKNIEIILINDGSKDNTGEICESFASQYPQNITYISKNHEGKGASRNLGLEKSRGEYINFLDGEDYLSRNALKEVLNFFNKHETIDIVTTPIKLIDASETKPNPKYRTSKVVNLLENPEYYQAQTKSCFIKKSALENVSFSAQLKLSEDITRINQILIKNPKLGICSEATYFTRKEKDSKSLLNILSTYREFHPPEVKYYFKNLIRESMDKFDSVPVFIQRTILYYCNEIILNENIQDKLTDEEIEALTGELVYMMQYIDDENIYNQQEMNDRIKTFLIFMKNGFSYSSKDQIKLTKDLKLDTVYVDIYEIIGNELYLLANINSIYDIEKVDMYVNGEKVETKVIDFPQRKKYYLNQKYLFNHTFESRLKLDPNKKYDIQFKSNINEKLTIDFSRPCNFSKVVGYAKTKKYLSRLENNKIVIEKTKTGKWIKQELKTLFGMLKKRVPGFESGIPIRILYMLLYPFLKNKRIWFYTDFPTIADDNGKHLFRYSMNQNEKGIKKYFIIDKKTKDYNEMKKIGPVIGYKSIKHRILGLFAEKIITSHPDNNYIYPFWGHYPNFAGLLKSSTIFLQHGITLNNISSWLNKYDKNLDFMVTASKKEYESLFKYHYNYEEDIIHLLGFPRFDSLEDEKTKTLLLMPSWRRYLTNENKYSISNSSYFKTYNALINNTRLIEKTKELGYEVIFRPHPHVYQYIGLFDENDHIKIDHERVSYQELFKKGALLITDYSSVAFDFAYLKKPVIYYQYGEDYHFNLEESYFDYKTMGFGEVCENEDELVDKICEYMENDCKMKEEHVKNVEDYFTFTDKNNCKRVHEAINKLPIRD